MEFIAEILFSEDIWGGCVFEPHFHGGLRSHGDIYIASECGDNQNDTKLES